MFLFYEMLCTEYFLELPKKFQKSFAASLGPADISTIPSFLYYKWKLISVGIYICKYIYIINTKQ